MSSFLGEWVVLHWDVSKTTKRKITQQSSDHSHWNHNARKLPMCRSAKQITPLVRRQSDCIIWKNWKVRKKNIPMRNVSKRGNRPQRARFAFEYTVQMELYLLNRYNDQSRRITIHDTGCLAFLRGWYVFSTCQGWNTGGGLSNRMETGIGKWNGHGKHKENQMGTRC